MRLGTTGDYLVTQQFAVNDLKNFFFWRYWTEADLSARPSYGLAGLVAIVLLVVGLVVWRRRLKKAEAVAPVYGGPINQLANIIVFMAIMTVSYAFFRSQAISYLSSRLVVLASALIVLGWIGWVVYYLRSAVPSKRREYLERERFFRYIPKSKTKVNGKTKTKKPK